MYMADQDPGVNTRINDDILIKAVLKLAQTVTLDRKHNIPYLAGYSTDAKRIYIDRDLPSAFKDSSGVTHNTDQFLILHESVEKALIDTWGLGYYHAHQIALRVEHAAVEAAGIDWIEYDSFMMDWVKAADNDEPLSDIPADLDLTPYNDENVPDFVEDMKKAMVTW